MTKEKLIKLEKTSDFIKAIQSLGYQPKSTKNGGSHVVYICSGKPSLSIVDGGHRTISIGVRRSICKLIFQ